MSLRGRIPKKGDRQLDSKFLQSLAANAELEEKFTSDGPLSRGASGTAIGSYPIDWGLKIVNLGADTLDPSKVGRAIGVMYGRYITPNAYQQNSNGGMPPARSFFSRKDLPLFEINNRELTPTGKTATVVSLYPFSLDDGLVIVAPIDDSETTYVIVADLESISGVSAFLGGSPDQGPGMGTPAQVDHGKGFIFHLNTNQSNSSVSANNTWFYYDSSNGGLDPTCSNDTFSHGWGLWEVTFGARVGPGTANQRTDTTKYSGTPTHTHEYTVNESVHFEVDLLMNYTPEGTGKVYSYDNPGGQYFANVCTAYATIPTDGPADSQQNNFQTIERTVVLDNAKFYNGPPDLWVQSVTRWNVGVRYKGVTFSGSGSPPPNYGKVYDVWMLIRPGPRCGPGFGCNLFDGGSSYGGGSTGNDDPLSSGNFSWWGKGSRPRKIGNTGLYLN